MHEHTHTHTHTHTHLTEAWWPPFCTRPSPCPGSSFPADASAGHIAPSGGGGQGHWYTRAGFL